MKKLLFYYLLLSSVYGFTQDTTPPLVDNFGINIGLINAGINYEKVLAKDFSVNTILEYNGGFYARFGGDTEYIFASTIALEPRYYYNRDRRLRKGKNISNNVGNYLAGDFSFGPVIGTISSDDNVGVVDSYVLGVKYGLRRKIVGDLNFELAFGVGKLFSKGYDSETIPILDLKLQYILF
ncbi:hypothetical protein [Dokdonia sp. Hel_I_53]|uniref:hypothetical protein n=1 Tax=Dokdonia sp. Hel_I_53 TaxID=1566287 RepID=UPI00119C2C23|nr:hypothetical protein [Dokdonia sp. Hel_I_53]TVZ51871.1 hypothetical protein OD90_1030 [Dokdonia sp. Hel_I_53]